MGFCYGCGTLFRFGVGLGIWPLTLLLLGSVITCIEFYFLTFDTRGDVIIW